MESAEYVVLKLAGCTHTGLMTMKATIHYRATAPKRMIQASLAFIVLGIVTLPAMPAFAVYSELDARRQGISYYDPTSIKDSGGGCGSNISLTGRNNVEQSFNFFVAKGLTAEQAAGIVGNLMAESTPDIDPTITQVPGGAGGGRGIAQWGDGVDGDRWGQLVTFAEATGQDPLNLGTQLAFLWFELTGEPATEGVTGGTYQRAYNSLTAAAEDGSVEDETTIFLRQFEGASIERLTERLDFAQQVFDEFGANAAPAEGGTGGTTGGTAAGAGACGVNSGGGVVSADGYAFPIAGTKAEIKNGYRWPCASICHHDNTAAFDLSHEYDDTSAGIPVYAITAGTIANFRNSYKGEVGCNTFQLEGEDGFHYWYGHIVAVAGITDGSQVVAGQQVAEIGPRRCTGNGSYPHLHIDRGSPQGRDGGSDCCRDAGITPLLNGLYELLP